MVRGLVRIVAIALLSAGLCALPAGAHETDQFTVPCGHDFVDQGAYWDQMLYGAICGGLDSLNSDIETALHIPVASIRELRLAELHCPDTVVSRVRRQLPSAYAVIEGLEYRAKDMQSRCGPSAKLFAWRPSPLDNIYSHFPYVPDPRQLNRVFTMRSSTIKIHGTYLGTDKVGHFVSMGHIYYMAYRSGLLLGASHKDAMYRATLVGQWGPLSERAIVGWIPCGIYSNADMVANYAGMKLYINLTEPICIKGIQVPSVLVRKGEFWALREGFCKECGYFSLFISDHLDEALNPCEFEWNLRHPIRAEVRKRSCQILDWYAGNDPCKRNPQHFDALLNEYSTFYGEPYGHSGDPEDLITIGNSCFESR